MKKATTRRPHTAAAPPQHLEWTAACRGEGLQANSAFYHPGGSPSVPSVKCERAILSSARQNVSTPLQIAMSCHPCTHVKRPARRESLFIEGKEPPEEKVCNSHHLSLLGYALSSRDFRSILSRSPAMSHFDLETRGTSLGANCVAALRVLNSETKACPAALIFDFTGSTGIRTSLLLLSGNVTRPILIYIGKL